MAYNTKNVITDLSGLKPAPQYFNTTADAYEVVQGAFGAPRAMLYDINGNPLFTAANPGNVQLMGSNVADAQTLWTPGMLYNETTSDKPRGNTEGTLLASAARTATSQSPNQTNYNGNGAFVEVTVTAIGTSNLQLLIVGRVNGNTHILTGSPNITAAGKYLVEIGHGIGAASNEVVVRQNARLPRTWYVLISHVDVSSWTYSVGYSMNVT